MADTDDQGLLFPIEVPEDPTAPPRWLNPRPSRRRLVLGVVLILALVVAVVTELVCGAVADFWADHPFLTSIVASALLLALTVVFVDEALRRREGRRWRKVATTAYRELDTDAMGALARIFQKAGLLEDLPPGEEARPLWEILNSDRAVQFGVEVIYSEIEFLGQSIARWAPVMLANPELAEALHRFAAMRDELTLMQSSILAKDAAGAFAAFNKFGDLQAAFSKERGLAEWATGLDD